MKNQFPKYIKEKFKNIYAKYYDNQKETLEEHNNNLQKVADSLFKIFEDNKVNIPFEINKYNFSISILFHDLGKAEKGWLDNKKDLNTRLVFRHELISFLVAYEFIRKWDISNFEKLCILMPIINHHNKFYYIKDGIKQIIEGEDNNFINERDSTMITNSVFNQKNLPIYWEGGLDSIEVIKKFTEKYKNKCANSEFYNKIINIIEDLSKDITEKQSYEIFFYNSLMCVCDQLASQNITDIIEVSKKIIPDKKFNKKQDVLLRDYQDYIVDISSDDDFYDMLFIDLQPGAGKTLITKEIADKSKRHIIHAVPKNIIGKDLASKTIEEYEDIDEIKSENITNRYLWFNAHMPILYTTPDSIHLMSQGFKRHFMFIRSLVNGIIVLDEFHDCYTDKDRNYNLNKMLDKLLFFNIKIIMMSGTTPKKLVKKWTEKCKNYGKTCHYVSDIHNDSDKIYHEVNGKEKENMPNIMISSKIKGKITFINEEYNKEQVSGFRWYDKKEFSKGHFNRVLEIIRTKVIENKTVAILFKSKKSLCHFIHMFDLFSEFKNNIDYTTICSPKMCCKSHHCRIYEALEDLNKNNVNNNKKYKFVLCTDYVEMGVDFSVDTIITEIDFLHKIVQKLGRLNRWYLSDGAEAYIFPSYTRELDDNYLKKVYNNHYIDLIKFWNKKCGDEFINIEKGWYTESEINNNFEWQKLINHYLEIEDLIEDKNTGLVDNDYFSSKIDDYISSPNFKPIWKKLKNVKNGMSNSIFDFIKVCGVFRARSSEDASGMYRVSINKDYEYMGEIFNVPRSKFDESGNNLRDIPHPELFL